MTIKEPVNAVVLAAGRGTRMRSQMPKVLHPLAGRAMLVHVLATVSQLSPVRQIVVIGAGAADVAKAVAPAQIVVQDPPMGTGHALMCARDLLEGAQGTVLVLFGDSPLITAATLVELVAAREAGAAVAVLGFRPADPAQYGRLVCDQSSSLTRIVEFKDAAPSELEITLCNGGVMAIAAQHVHALLSQLDNKNAQSEYYLTDLVRLAREAGLSCAVVEGPADEVLGVNSRAELALAEDVLQQRLRARAMDEGATLVDPASIYFSHDTQIGRDVVVGPNVVFGPGVTVADRVVIKPFCHIEGTLIEAGAIIGPFARLRPGASVGEDAHVGNFVELKNTRLEKGAKANHLAYLGDAKVGAGANIGAGTITCNYDGFDKFVTDIGAGAFVGSNSSLVAPVRIGNGAYVGSGSVVTDDVADDALAIARGRQVAREGWANTFRARKREEKAQRNKKD